MARTIKIARVQLEVLTLDGHGKLSEAEWNRFITARPPGWDNQNVSNFTTGHSLHRKSCLKLVCQKQIENWLVYERTLSM